MICLCAFRLSTMLKKMMTINYSTSLKALLRGLVGVGRLRPFYTASLKAQLLRVELKTPLLRVKLKALLQTFKLKVLFYDLLGVGHLPQLSLGVGRSRPLYPTSLKALFLRLRPLCLTTLKALFQMLKSKALLQRVEPKALFRRVKLRALLLITP